MVQLLMTDLQFKTSKQNKYNKVRITHMPTGLSGEAEGEGYLTVRERAFEELQAKVDMSEVLVKKIHESVPNS